MAETDDLLNNIASQFKDLGIAEDEFEALLQRSIVHGTRPEPSEWIRDKSVDFYLGMLAGWRLSSSFYKARGIVLRNLKTGRSIDDEIGEEIITVLISTLK